MTGLLELVSGAGLIVAVLISFAAVAHDDGRIRLAPVPVRRRR